MKLVDDARDGWKWISTWGLTLLAAVPPVWASLPPDAKAMLPDAWEPWALSIIAIGALIGRFVDQK